MRKFQPFCKLFQQPSLKTAHQTGFLRSNRFDFGLDNFQINLLYKVVTKVTIKFIAPSLAFLCILLWQPSIVNHCFPSYYNGAINYIQIYGSQMLSSELKWVLNQSNIFEAELILSQLLEFLFGVFNCRIE